MAGSYVTIQVSGVKYVLDTSTETIKVLLCTANITTTTQDSLIDANTGTDYQVTAGKTFTALGAFLVSGSGTGQVLIYQGDSADAITTLKATLNTFTTTVPYQSEIPLTFTIAAAKYITNDQSAANIAGSLIIVGYES